jgi:hypothetical protein
MTTHNDDGVSAITTIIDALKPLDESTRLVWWRVLASL